MSTESNDLRAELRELTERVAALEGRVQEKASGGSETVFGAEEFWALEGLRSRLALHPTTQGGAVMLLGSLTLPTGEPVAWQQTAGTEGVVESDWADRAAAFAALGHPIRLELLRRILQGVRSTAELAAIESLGTTGQLHHHLRQLLAIGWVRQSGRGTYEVPAARIVPLLVCLAGAER